MDKDGFVYIRGRSKNVILGPAARHLSRAGGTKIEQYALCGRISGSGAQSPATRRVVYPDFEALDSDHIPESRISKLMEENRTEVNKQLSDFSRIIKIQIASEPFQKTPTQKLKRSPLQLI